MFCLDCGGITLTAGVGVTSYLAWLVDRKMALLTATVHIASDYCLFNIPSLGPGKGPQSRPPHMSFIQLLPKPLTSTLNH